MFTDVAKCYAMCDWFDETCVELFDHLEKRRLSEDTVILCICDNGWAAASTNGDDPNQELWNGYALCSKGSPYDSGIRTPILVSWPGKIPPSCDLGFAHAIDFFPTIAAFAGLAAPADLTGIKLLDKEAVKSRDAVFGVTHSVHNMTPGDPDDTLQYLWCVEDEWKLIVRFGGRDTTNYRKVHIWGKAPTRLYRIKDDPHEKYDIADQYPEVVERLRKKIYALHLAGR
jgi:arylsulfatase A-like enzyme